MVAVTPPGFDPPTTGPRARQRLWAEVALAITALASVGWIALLVVFTARSCACPASSIPLGAVIEFGPAAPATGPDGHWANFTVLNVSDGVVLGDLHVSFRGSADRDLPATPGWSLTVNGPTGATFGVYDPWTGGWNSGASIPVVNGTTFHAWTLGTDLSGGAVEVEGVAQFSGTVVVPVISASPAVPAPIR